jgi:Domain of unknown function (DUF397)
MHYLNLRWRKSSYSGCMNSCVEVAALDTTRAVRDTTDPTGPALIFTAAQWSAFTASVRAGLFD